MVEGLNMVFITWLLAFVLGSSQQAAPAAQRFDYLVRADFFAGIAGDDARMQHAKTLCEDALAANPKHAEAMVWHGAILFAEAGRSFQKGDVAAGGELMQRGIKDMSDAVVLAPDNPGVLIPRAAVLIEGTKGMPPEMARPLLESAIDNYERVLKIQEPMFPTLGDHAKGELLFGLAEGSARLGRQDKAKMYFDRLISDAPTSGQAPRAKAWMETGAIPKPANAMGCVGCHK